MDAAANKPRRSERKRTVKFHVVDLRLGRYAVRYAKIAGKTAATRQRRYRATTENRADKKYKVSAKGKATNARAQAKARAKVLAKMEEEREAWKAWLASLTPVERLRVLDEEAAIKAVEKAMKADNSREWAYAMGKAKRICRDLAAALRKMDGPAWLHSIFARKKVGKEIFCEDGSCANNAIKVKACKGLIIHASNVGPYALDLVGGKRFMLRPAAKWDSSVPVPYVYGTASNDPALALQFVGLAGTMVSAMLVDRFGRRPLLLASTGLMALCAAGLATALGLNAAAGGGGEFRCVRCPQTRALPCVLVLPPLTN